MKKLVLFGAGKIGRSFVAQLFCMGGYETVFVDIQEKLVDELNRRRSYNIIVKAARESIIVVKNVRAVRLSDSSAVTKEIMEADLLAVSVGVSGLTGAMEAIATGLVARYNLDPGLKTDIIIAENLRNTSEYFVEELYRFLPVNYPLKELVGLVDTCIEKMVPLMKEEDLRGDLLRVYAEPFNTLILNGPAFKNPQPEIPNVVYKDNIKAWADRKLFLMSLGHAATAYLGYLYNPRLVYTWEVLDIPSLYREIRDTMMQSAFILQYRYPEEFTISALEKHIDELLDRFRNKHLGDTLFRIGCDLFRKLGPDERLSRVIRTGLEAGLPTDKILYVLVCGIYFRATDENGSLFGADILFHNRYQSKLDPILREVCGFEEEIFGSLYKKARYFNLQIQGLA